MILEVRHRSGQRLTVEVDLAKPPTLVGAPPAPGPEVCLNWDQAVDDQGFLRRCPVCGCRDLYFRKDFYRLTGLAVVLLAAILAMLLFGGPWLYLVVAVLGVIMVVDFAIWRWGSGRLVCYQCGSGFSKLPVPRDHPRWDAATAARYKHE
ncbi:MAG: hypothetical protein IT443_06115 [Phycisphaeraceae bacterium]|nr:hypothetical protein [Phycisphaeraceae bacterium]